MFMRYRFLSILPLLILCACEPVRTVYDSNGQEVEESEGATISDLNSRFEKEFQSSFMEKKTESGVPQTSSGKVSSFQKYLDDSRRLNKDYTTRSYGDASRNDLRSSTYADADTRYARDNERYDKEAKVAYSTDMRPDFMNDSRGISHSSRYSGADDSHRSAMDGLAAPGYRGHEYDVTADAGYAHGDTDHYVEGRRDKTPAPTITNYRDYYRKTIQDTRALLNREKKAEEGVE